MGLSDLYEQDDVFFHSMYFLIYYIFAALTSTVTQQVHRCRRAAHAGRGWGVETSEKKVRGSRCEIDVSGNFRANVLPFTGDAWRG